MVPGVAAVIRNNEREILLQRNTNGWSLPAGAVDPGETPAQAIVREVSEETGLSVRPLRVLGVFGGADGFRYTYANGDQVEYMCILFECEVLGGQLHGRDDETEDLHFFLADEMPQLPLGYPREIFSQPPKETYFQWSEHWIEGTA
jgi:8-oxo-dGTP pyrophosphatase MutT (NUDIX family)